MYFSRIYEHCRETTTPPPRDQQQKGQTPHAQTPPPAFLTRGTLDAAAHGVRALPFGLVDALRQHRDGLAHHRADVHGHGLLLHVGLHLDAERLHERYFVETPWADREKKRQKKKDVRETNQNMTARKQALNRQHVEKTT